jgi:nondiscriminating glutamyl-tRNA synthetase
MNAHWLHHADGATLERWANAAGDGPSGSLPEGARRWPEDTRRAVLEAVRGNLATLADLPGELAPFLDEPLVAEPEAAAALAAPGAAAVCAAAADALQALAEWSAVGVKSAVRSLAPALGLQGRSLFLPLRAALTGRTHGPELPLVAELLGRERCVARLSRAAGREAGA